MDFPKDETALQQKYEFMFGKDLLIAPVLDPGVETWNVYLPETNGGWYDFWSEKRLASGQKTNAEATLDHIPVFVPAGSILPLGPTKQYVAEKPDDPIEIRIYPGADASFTLYEDEGVNYNYEKGQYSTIAFKWNDSASELQIGQRIGSFSKMPANRQFEVHLAGSSIPPQTVDYSGKEVRVHLK
jgi:alpha-D-xyloside xylohydrolase